MADGGTINYHFKGDDKDVISKLKGIGKVAGGVAAGLGAAFVAGTGVAIGAIANLTKQSVKSYAEYEQLTGGVETLFKEGKKDIKELEEVYGKSFDEIKNSTEGYTSVADNVISYAKDAYKTAGVSANQYMAGVNSFAAALVKSTGGSAMEAAEIADMAFRDMSDNANKMGTDMASIQNAYQGFAKQNYTLLDNLKLSYGGTKSEMERLLKDAEKISGVKYDINNLADVYNAIHVIQEEMNITGTTAEEAEHTISGSINMTKAAWENLVTSFGEGDEAVSQALDNFIESAGTVVNNLFPIIEKILTSLLNALPKVLNNIATKLPGAIQRLLPPLLTALTKLLQGVVMAIPLLLKTLVNALPMVIDSLISMLLDIVNALIDMLPTIIPLLVQAIIDGYLQILDHFDEIFNAGIELIVALADGIIDSLPILIEKMPMIILQLKMNIIKAAPKLIMAAFQIIWHLIKGIVAYTPLLIRKMPGIVRDMVNKLKERVSEFFDFGKNLLAGLWNGIKDKKEWLLQKIEGIGTSIKKTVKKALGISSPSKEFAIIGRFSMLGFEEGLEDMQPEIQKKIDSIFTLSPSMVGGMNTFSPNVNVVVNNNMEMDPLGQVVSKIKTFSGGAKNDYNYGQGV